MKNSVCYIMKKFPFSFTSYKMTNFLSVLQNLYKTIDQSLKVKPHVVYEEFCLLHNETIAFSFMRRIARSVRNGKSQS